MGDDTAAIEEKRRARRLKKELKATAQAKEESCAEVLDVNEHGFRTTFIERKFLPLKRDETADVQGPEVERDSMEIRPHIRLLTYNILAQSLVRRKLFPSSGEALKWKNRQHVLQRELKFYDADIMCLQEVGTDMLDPCLNAFFNDHEYNYEFHSGRGKLHGVLLAYRRKHFRMLHKKTVDFDHVEVVSQTMQDGKKESLPNSNNVGLICVFEHVTTTITFTIATTHLFWHPRGTYERSRQIDLLVTASLQVSEELCTHNRIIIAGDLNTEPLDPTYLALTKRPYIIDELGQQIMRESTMQTVKDSDDLVDAASLTQDRHKNPLECRATWQERLHRLSNGPQFNSLYARHYSNVDPDNCGPHGEPRCTNFANVYRGTLDYIMIPAESLIECKSLLQMPDTAQLEHGQPQEGQFPSDHFALGCSVTID